MVILRLTILKVAKYYNLFTVVVLIVLVSINQVVSASKISGKLEVDLDNTLSGIVEENITVTNLSTGQSLEQTPTPTPTPAPTPSKTPKPKIIKKTSSKLSGQINNFYVENAEKPEEDAFSTPTITPKKIQFAVLTVHPSAQSTPTAIAVNQVETQANILGVLGNKLLYYLGVIWSLWTKILSSIASIF